MVEPVSLVVESSVDVNVDDELGRVVLGIADPPPW
jgi:hypothetical protein